MSPIRCFGTSKPSTKKSTNTTFPKLKPRRSKKPTKKSMKEKPWRDMKNYAWMMVRKKKRTRANVK